MTTPRAHIGTSGWSFGNQRGFFGDVPKSRWLEHCASRFSGLEINATFYRQQRASTFHDWAARTPPDFRMTIKAHRFITHIKRLSGVAASVARLRAPALAMGEKLACVLWQLPANFGVRLAALEDLADAVGRWPETRHAVELRNPSWFNGEVAALLRERRMAVCLSDAADWPMWDEVTTDLVYVRLHGHTRTYKSRYTRPHLEAWADRVVAWLDEGREVHVYFDNDAEGAAPFDALALIDLVAGRGAAHAE